MKNLWVLGALMLLPAPALAATVTELQTGHFVQLRGDAGADNLFVAGKITLKQPEDEETLIGTIVADERGRLRLLGYPLALSSDLKLRGLARSKLAGRRAKAEGRLHADGTFEVATLSQRGAGRDRLEGTITHVATVGDWLELKLLDHTILLPLGMTLVIDENAELADVRRIAPSDQFFARGQPDEDDRFGNGLEISNSLRLTARVQVESEHANNLNFDDSNAEDRDDVGSSLRARMEWQPDNDWFGRGELRYSYQRRDREDRPLDTREELELGEAYVGRYLNQDTRVIVGRQDFDDDREFVFDENLDALRLNTSFRNLQLDASVSRMFDNDGSREEDATNVLLYLSNTDRDRRLAAYWLHRSFADRFDETSYHVGVRAQGEWLPNSELWIDLAHQGGRRADERISAWAFDVGSIWYLDDDERWYAVTGIAFASGDDPDTTTDEQFRQTGLQDNNGRFGGETSFRYYGEVADPELSNLIVSTLGVGHRLTETVSLDVVAHEYRLHRASIGVLEGNWDSDLTGASKRLGTGADIVFGYSGYRRWEVESVLGYLQPDDAFENSDAGWVAKLQLRMRY